MADLLTISDLRRLTVAPTHILNHAIDRFGPEPVGRIGIARVWRADQVADVQESSRRTSQRSTIRERRGESTAPALV